MLYVFMIILLIIPILDVVYVIFCILNYEKVFKRKCKFKEKPMNSKYVSLRCRNSIREEMNKFKSISEFYEIENNIKYP